MTILLLEDDYALHSAIKKILLQDSHKVQSYYDGAVAHADLSEIIDLYILDINVPKIDGLDVLEKIKFINPNSKVIMISANSDLISIQNAYNRGCDDYIKKPFYIEELQIKINNFDTKKNNKLQISNNLYYELNSDILFKNEAIVVLSRNEQLLLRLLVDNINTVVFKEQIFTLIETRLDSFSNDALRSLVKRLRQKVGKIYIQTVVNEGYLFKLTAD